jgi:hypothetical protein
MITVIYTTVRAEITHDEPFDNKFQALEYAQELLDYKNVLGGMTTDNEVRVTAVEVVEDDVTQYNVEEVDAI